jgi:sodium-dependent dicarboxylate transporter 2/3/5
MAFAVPLMSINLVLSWLWLSFISWRENRVQNQLESGVVQTIDPKAKQAQIHKVMEQKYKALGPMKCHEVSVLICFLVVILLWFFRRPLFMYGKCFKNSFEQFDATSCAMTHLLVQSPNFITVLFKMF